MKKIAAICGLILFSLTACQTTAEKISQANSEIAAAKLSQNTFANEDKNWGVTGRSEIRTGQYHAPTPTTIPNSSVITTAELLKIIKTDPKVVLVDVLGGNNHPTIPNAVWLKGAGLGTSFEDSVQNKLANDLSTLTKQQTNRPIVFFCLSSECWLSYNATLRANHLGYSNTYWYRGGLEAWKAAGLPTVMTN